MSTTYNVEEFCKVDPMMIDICQEMTANNNFLDRDTLIMLFKFFNTFCMGFKRAKLDEYGELYRQRVDALYYLMVKMGYKYGKRRAGFQDNGMEAILNAASHSVKIE